MEDPHNGASLFFMLRLFYILLLSLTFTLANGQNLVPNHGFEDYIFCPDLPAQIDSSCKEWFTPLSVSNIYSPPFTVKGNGSSDYFNRCNLGIYVSVPKNGIGYQNASEGNGYAGFSLSIGKNSGSLNNHTYKEYIENFLSEQLIMNTDYCIELKYSLAEFEFWDVINVRKLYYFPVKLGFLLTDTIVKRYMQTGISQPLNICATPNFETYTVTFKDTVNWIHIKGHFKANGGERYLTIGNFECTPTDYNPDSVAVYIYIDDVKLYKCDPDSVNNKPVDSLLIPNIFTPNEDGFNDKFNFQNQEQWNFETQVFSRWGNLVFDNKSSQSWDGTYVGEKVSAGVYFYIIKAQAIKTGEVKVHKGTVTVMY